MQKILKSFLLLNLLFTFSLVSHAATLGLDDTEEPVFILRDDAGSDLNELHYNLGGDGSTSDAAITLYVPYGASGDQNSAYYIDGADLADGTSTDGGIYFQDIDSKGHNNEELYVAIKDNDNGSSASYRIVSEISSSELESPFVNFISICSTSELNCAGITDAISAIKEDIELVFFFMPKDTDYSTNDEVTIPDTVGQALFFKLIISAAVADIQDNASINVESTYGGDTTAVLGYTGSHGGNGTYIERLVAYIEDNMIPTTIPGVDPTTPPTNATKADVYRILEETGSEDGNAKITKLQNGLYYRVSIAYLDNFGFTSELAESYTFQPRPIEKLLAENQCYFVTAGFGHDHYVLDYFRLVRDEFLMNFWAGRMFVEFYYSTAPNFVKYILENKALAFTIRVYSFSIYFVLQNILFILGCITLISTITFRREIKKCLIKY